MPALRHLRGLRKLARWDECIKRLPYDCPSVFIEIGVWRGDTMARVLRARPRCTAYGVDPWTSPEPGSSYAESGSINAKLPQEHYDRVYDECMRKLKPFEGRYQISRMTSALAAEGCSMYAKADVIFIDGDHSFEAVLADIGAWAPYVKQGGWLGGHDYDHPRYPGVRQAIEAHSLQVELGADRTWWSQL